MRWWRSSALRNIGAAGIESSPDALDADRNVSCDFRLSRTQIGCCIGSRLRLFDRLFHDTTGAQEILEHHLSSESRWIRLRRQESHSGHTRLCTPAYGGVLLGRDAGEFGGELVFRGQDGTIQRLLPINVHGIFQMPFGVVAFAGLAHLTMNEGGIYLVSCSSTGAISASLLQKLPGAPSDIFRTTDGDLVFRVMSGRFEKRGNILMPVKDCYLLSKLATVEPLRCSSIVKAASS